MKKNRSCSEAVAIESRQAMEKGGEFGGGVSIKRDRASPANGTDMKTQGMFAQQGGQTADRNRRANGGQGEKRGEKGGDVVPFVSCYSIKHGGGISNES
jgi:hypothetical protein